MPSEAITPSGIFEEFDTQPPLMRRSFMEKYLGMEVDWSVTFADAWEGHTETVRVAFRFEPHSVRMITSDVLLSDYPRLRNLRAGEPLRVRGRIREVSRLWIELDVAELLFCIEAEPIVA